MWCLECIAWGTTSSLLSLQYSCDYFDHCWTSFAFDILILVLWVLNNVSLWDQFQDLSVNLASWNHPNDNDKTFDLFGLLTVGLFLAFWLLNCFGLCVWDKALCFCWPGAPELSYCDPNGQLVSLSKYCAKLLLVVLYNLWYIRPKWHISLTLKVLYCLKKLHNLGYCKAFGTYDLMAF